MLFLKPYLQDRYLCEPLIARILCYLQRVIYRAEFVLNFSGSKLAFIALKKCLNILPSKNLVSLPIALNKMREKLVLHCN